MTKLSDEEIAKLLTKLPDWDRDTDSGGITRLIEFETFADAIAFVDRIAPVADEEDHHPDIDIRYRRVKLVLVSHDIGGLSSRDFKMAALIDKLL